MWEAGGQEIFGTNSIAPKNMLATSFIIRQHTTIIHQKMDFLNKIAEYREKKQSIEHLSSSLLFLLQKQVMLEYIGDQSLVCILQQIFDTLVYQCCAVLGLDKIHTTDTRFPLENCKQQYIVDSMKEKLHLGPAHGVSSWRFQSLATITMTFL